MISATRLYFYRGETVEQCVEHANAWLSVEPIHMITNTEFTADDEGYILLVSVVEEG